MPNRFLADCAIKPFFPCGVNTRWNLDAQESKLKEWIDRRKAKGQRLIKEQGEAYLATMDSKTYQHRQDYLRALSSGKNKLYRLKQELLTLEAGRLLHEI